MERINARQRAIKEKNRREGKVGKTELKQQIEQALAEKNDEVVDELLPEELSYKKAKIQYDLDGRKNPAAQKQQIEVWRKKILDAKNSQSSSFKAINRDKATAIVRRLPDGNQNLAKYNPKFNLIQKNISYE